MARPLVALLTDFGRQDAYVGAMKGVLLGLLPDAAIVDLSHEVPPQDVHAAAFLLETCVDAFPSHTVYLCVVDPGVGTRRRALALETPLGCFVGPDNGVFSYVLARFGRPRRGPQRVPPPTRPAAAPPGVAAFQITNRALFRPMVSTTFHGRDVFAPVAARLAGGLPAAEVGPALGRVQAFVPPSPQWVPRGVEGCVVHVDHYGNLITNLRPEDLPARPAFHLGGITLQGLSRTYQDGPELLALVGSSGRVEVAARNGNAAAQLGLGRWAPVRVTAGGAAATKHQRGSPASSPGRRSAG